MFKLKNSSSWIFLKFIQKNIGIHFYLFIIVTSLVGLLDGLGLALFIPLLSATGGAEESSESLGKLKYLTDFLLDLGINLNLINVLIIMVIIFTFKGVITFLKSIYDARLRLYIVKKIRFNLIDSLQKVSYKGFSTYDAGKIQNTLTVQVEKMVLAMNFYFRTIQNIVMLITYITLAFMSNWQFSILIAIGGLISNYLYKYINKITLEAARGTTQTGNIFNTHIIQTLNNFKYLKATNYIEKYNIKVKNVILKTQNLEYRMLKYNALADSAREPITILVIISVIIIQVKLMGSPFMGILVSLLFFYRALTYLTAAQSFTNLFLNNSAGFEAIEELKKELEKDAEKEQSLYNNLKEIKTIELQNVNLNYGKKRILSDISLKIEKNKTIALIGESGAGKTTLANILCGLIVPDSGSIRLNNEEIQSEGINNFRKKIGYITQDPVIFNDSIFNNITFWSKKNKENLKNFWKCIELVNLKEFINSLPEKEDAPLGSNGILVSGGQKQRISIARELYKNMEILIMDEATSALDSETESHIKENIEHLQGRYTIIIIAHRLSTIKHADCIYLMKNGKIESRGNYKELYDNSDKFRQMINFQEL